MLVCPSCNSYRSTRRDNVSLRGNQVLSDRSLLSAQIHIIVCPTVLNIHHVRDALVLVPHGGTPRSANRHRRRP